ncbi:MAG TPA: hypothetical protein PKL31_15325 [Fulvivirga sp.]|nr:hypothetical protein [Fulvivirga sp.]
MIKTHSFHIPVMGLAFTIDTPLKVAHYGIDSVISLGDDMLIEKMRKVYAEKYDIAYKEINSSEDDYRAKRITAYLNLINDLVEKKFELLNSDNLERQSELRKLYNLLPASSTTKKQLKQLKSTDLTAIEKLIKENLTLGKIDVNIMTKVDKENYVKNEKLPVEYNDAHAGVRGYANSNLNSSLVLSAGLNPRLFSYMENFDDFFPNEQGEIKKKIVLKVSDYRSALIQGKFLAKKGLWVSEFRIESGLNCGGHAFATEGYLMGPILAQFRDERQELTDTLHEIFIQGLERANRTVPQQKLGIKITAQGGVGTAEEHEFLLNHYQLSSVGWGTPFLLVPEATTVDEGTREKLAKAKEKDLYLSNISPLGVPFHNLRSNTKDQEKERRKKRGKPGSPCPKKFLSLNKEFTEKAICTASRQYQSLKIKELDEAGLDKETYNNQYNSIVEKACICVGLGTSALLTNGLNTKVEGPGVSICPGPNLAYFSNIISLNTMVDHIYGRGKSLTTTNRPNLFIKELGMYMDVLKNKCKEAITPKSDRSLMSFMDNLNEGIDYYENLIGKGLETFKEARAEILKALEESRQIINRLKGAHMSQLVLE